MKPTLEDTPQQPFDTSLRDLYVQALLLANDSAADAQRDADLRERAEIIRLADEGITPDEIAATLGVSLDAIRRALHR